METVTKKIGRPAKEKALTTAERQRRHRARVKRKLEEQEKMIDKLNQYERQLRALASEREAVKKTLETVLRDNMRKEEDTISIEIALGLVSRKIPS
jgi:hypothetical protein